MDYQVIEQITKIAQFLNTSAGDPNVREQDPLLPDEDVEWDCSRFLAKLLLAGEVHPGAATLDGFEAFKTYHENTFQVKIDAKGLFDRQWLRRSFGYINLAGAVSYACLTFDEISTYRTELQFISDMQLTDDQNLMDTLKCEKPVFQAKMAAYELANGLKLDPEGVYFRKWFREENEMVSFSNVEAWFQQYLDHWDDFRFLTAYKQELTQVDKNFIRIPEAELIQIHADHQTMFPATPSIEAFIISNTFVLENGTFRPHFYGGYWHSFGDQINGYLWTFLFRDDSRPNKQAALKEWLYKTRLIDCYDGLSVSSKPARENFCDEAYLLLKNEEDLKGAKEEMSKIMLDSTRARGDLKISRSTRYVEINGKAPYEVYKQLTDDMEDNLDHLYDQRSRDSIAKLIKTFVLHERPQIPAYGPDSTLLPSEFYHRIKELLRSGIQRPYLLWKISFVVVRDRQEILPYIFTDPLLADLGVVITDEIPFRQDHEEKNALLWEYVIDLMLNCATRLSFGTVRTAQIVFRAFLQLNQDKYRLVNRPIRRRQALTQNTINIRDRREKEVLGLFADAKLNPGTLNGSGITPFLLPDLFSALTGYFKTYQQREPYRNGSIQFPMAQWDGLFWLMKTALLHRYKPQFDSSPPDIRSICNIFLRSYLKLLETDETQIFDYMTQREKNGLPSWSEKIERLDRLDWLYPVCLLFRFGQLEQFLNPRIQIEVADDDYHEKNRLRAMQLRTHIGVLLQVLKKLVSPVVIYGFERTEMEQVRARLETKLVEYVTHYSSSDPLNGKIDLFEFNREESIFGGGNEALLPQLARAINWFSDKRAIIEAIQSSGDVEKFLTIGEWITSQGIRQKLLEQAEQADIFELMGRQRWIPELQSILLKISQYPELIEKIEESLIYYEIHVAEIKKDESYKLTAYRIRLLIAYIKMDEQQLDQEELPDRSHPVDRKQLSDYEYKEFYRGLIRIKNAPESAYHIFNALLRRHPTYPSIALNRLVAAYNWGDETGSSSKYREALAEWEEASATFDQEVLQEIEPNVSEILLSLYFKLNYEDQFDELFNALDLPFQMLPDILQLRVDSLVVKGRRAEAFYWIETAQKYHQFADLADIQFIEDLKLKTSGTENIDELIIHYGRIFNSSAEKLIRILPAKLNGKTDLGEFITQEFVFAADKMLEKIKAIEDIRDENKYNDLVEVILESKVNQFGWNIGGQKRGAFSATNGPQPGERDLPVIGADGKIIMTGEALIYRGATNAIPHLNKVFNYYHQRELMLILFYDTGSQSMDFKANWNDYQNNVLPACTYPTGHEPSAPFSDVSADYKVKNSAIKVGKSALVSGGIIYHLFIHINYFLNPVLPVTVPKANV